MSTTTWKPHTKHGELDAADRDELPDSVYAFPKERKEPLTDAEHVRNALARFDQVKDVTDEEREQAFANIKKAAKHFDVEIPETSQLFSAVNPDELDGILAAPFTQLQRKATTRRVRSCSFPSAPS